MIERAWLVSGWRALPLLVCVGCATAHDVDAVSPGLRDNDASVGQGTSGASGRASAGSSGQSGSSAGGRGGAGGSLAGGGRGGSGSGTGGRSGGSGRGGGGNLPCSPCSSAMSMSMMGMTFAACCTQDNQCGLDIGPLVGGGSQCVRQNAPGTESMTCPSYTFQGNFQLTSCCGDDGFCGVFIRQTAPLGCVDPELLGDLVSADQGSGGGMFFGGGQNQGGRERCN